MTHAKVSHSVGGLVLRAYPNHEAEQLDIAAPGDPVELVARLGNGWAHVRYKKQDGWMWSRDLVDVPAAHPRHPPQALEWWEDWMWIPLAVVAASAIVALVLWLGLH